MFTSTNLSLLDDLRRSHSQAVDDAPPGSKPDRLKIFNAHQLDQIPQLASIPHDVLFDMRVVSSVLPFRVNNFVLENLIDWSRVPDDPIYRLVFPQRAMLSQDDFDAVAAHLREGGPTDTTFQRTVSHIRESLSRDPGEQKQLNVPYSSNGELSGLQHKYTNTVLVFPSAGQTCHTYCTFCFRWSQFVQDGEFTFRTGPAESLFDYLREHREVNDVLFTGGDPMVMNARRWDAYLKPLLSQDLDHIRSIRIGTKALSFWPYRFTRDADADALMALFETVVERGKHLSIMAHFDHPNELDPQCTRDAVRRIRESGAAIRSQGPILANINDSPSAWAGLWQTQLELGISPYYQFVERDTGARRYFEVPLARALDIYRGAIKHLPGLARTARGPVMSTGPGKIVLHGATAVGEQKAFVMSFLQARDPAWLGQVFFADYDPEATWFSQLEPLGGTEPFFFTKDYNAMIRRATAAESAH